MDILKTKSIAFEVPGVSLLIFMVSLLFYEILGLLVRKCLYKFLKQIHFWHNKKRKADQYRFIRKNSSWKLRIIEIENEVINYNIQG